MSASNSWETAAGKLYFQNVAHTPIGDSSGIKGSDTAGSLFISLHTADPTDAADQTTLECTFTGYARAAVPRGTTTWTVTNGNISNSTTVAFAQCTAGSNTVTHFGVGATSSSTGHLICSGALNASLAISAGVTASFTSGQLDVDIE